MKQLNLVLVVGTRPQIIKSAPLIHLANRDNEIDLEIVHTGQHYDYEMSQIFFEELDLPRPTANLEVGSGTQSTQVAKIMMRLERLWLKKRPDLVIVPGDTNSTLAGALTAAKLGIPVAHIEAGARSYDMGMPEEINRRLTDHCSAILFAPTENCLHNLEKENIRSPQIFLTGDTMYDVLLQHLPKAEKSDVLTQLDLQKEGYVLLTLHRPENVDNPETLAKIFGALEQVKDLLVVFPVHPRTSKQLQGRLHRQLLKQKHVKLIKPVSYLCNLNLIKNARTVMTDSGGIQKEAFWLHTPCITPRNNTEWIETVELKANYLTGSDTQKILQALQRTVSDKKIKESLRKLPNPFGDGTASRKIVKALKEQNAMLRLHLKGPTP
jgi:UDP-N-acetylglucosamine 2-epimerase (non-hydrolysing)